MQSSRQYMQRALELARKAAQLGEVPVAALIVDKQGQIIAEAINQVERDFLPTRHAEILAMEDAARRLKQRYLEDYSLYVTLEPCAMCAGAIAHMRIAKVVFAAYDLKSGGVEQGARVFDHAQCHHKPEIIGGIQEREAKQLLKDFFAGLR